MVEVSFVFASPGWEILRYYRGGEFETSPVVAWAVHAIDANFVQVSPVASDIPWSVEDNWPVCTPDGEVEWGDEQWPTIWLWLEEMKRREVAGELNTNPSPKPSEGNAPVVLENYRRKFERGD